MPFELLLAATTALAEPSRLDPRFAVAVGYETTANDAALIRHGPRIGVTLNLNDWVELGVGGAWYPILVEGGCYAEDIADPQLVCPVSEKLNISYNLSRLAGSFDAELRILPLRARFGAWETAVGLATNAGFVATEDDLFVMMADDEPPDGPAHRTASQVLPSFGGGLFGDVRHEHLGFRLHLRALDYIEVTRGDRLYSTAYLLAGAEVLWWF